MKWVQTSVVKQVRARNLYITLIYMRIWQEDNFFQSEINCYQETTLVYLLYMTQHMCNIKKFVQFIFHCEQAKSFHEGMSTKIVKNLLFYSQRLNQDFFIFPKFIRTAGNSCLYCFFFPFLYHCFLENWFDNKLVQHQ